MELFLKLVSGECRSVYVSGNATVGELKRAAAQNYEVPISRVRLSMGNGLQVILQNESSSLSSYGLSSGSTVMLLLLAPFQVFIKNEKGQLKTYDVTEEETVDELQRKVYNKEGTPIDQQRLIFGGRQLDSGTKLKEYGITNGSTIHMTLRLRGG
ncbi:polyubiquitin 12-like [Pygocentrus nattereri]|uniref:polyubiquitin 12-like n=1 Tax=Pygocentrus nattereri TaxID=42514 RepID=UPI0008142DEA|nr:polyubiquitin 12-like [Pygocentrus nattereri]